MDYMVDGRDNACTTRCTRGASGSIVIPRHPDLSTDLDTVIHNCGCDSGPWRCRSSNDSTLSPKHPMHIPSPDANSAAPALCKRVVSW